MASNTTAGLLVAPHPALRASGGGVQVAGREYAAVLEAAGWKLKPVPFELRLSHPQRVLNRLRPQVARLEQPIGLDRTVEKALRESAAKFVFFFPNLFPSLSRGLRRNFPDVRQILLSVGIESLDFCIAQRLHGRAGSRNRSRRQAARMLGQQLLNEAEQRGLIDAVITLSPLEAEVEKWLGTPRVLWVTRTITETALEMKPVDGRVGCVSTLDHPPNGDGLERLFVVLEREAPANFRFRLVGRPESEGRKLAAQFPFVDYLGALDDGDLQKEAATWCCFVHPLFTYAKGCSTKLAVGLGWGLPVATTEFGVRGYEWDSDVLPLAASPEKLADIVLERSRAATVDAFSQQTQRIVEQTPSCRDIGAVVRQFLLGNGLAGEE